MEKYNIYLSHYTQDQGKEHNKVIIIIIIMIIMVPRWGCLKVFWRKKKSYFIHSFWQFLQTSFHVCIIISLRGTQSISGCKESQFNSLPFGQAVPSMY